MNRCVRAVLVSGLFCLLCHPAAFAQTREGSTGAAWAGAALGAYSGATLGLLASLEPCNRTLDNTRCARIGAAIGGGVAMVSGALMGAWEADTIDARWNNVGFGALIGSALGLGLRRAIRHYGWQDVGAAAALGAGIGASPHGAGIGFGLGAAVGGVLWLAVPGVGLPEAVGLSLAGLAVGGLAEWVGAAASAREGQGSFVLPQVQIRF